MAFCWSTFPALFYIVLFILIGYFISSLIGSKFASRASFLLTSILVCAVIYYFYTHQNIVIPKETKTENIKINPPRKSSEENGNNIDYLFDKEIKWKDFIPNNYSAKYSTSSLAFFDTQGKHKKYAAEDVSNDPIQYFNTLYNELEQTDNSKIDAVTKILSAQASSKNLNMLQTAEMVVTFIQEIPYCLVHDWTCEEIVKNGNSDFITSYHKDGKQCLPNIPAGVQSPYEFLHNLKGDCDTRSLLGYAILKKLNIPASLWVSSTYGHSILGVGLPVGGGSYKNIQGVNHYAVELTSKGFRIGMIPAEIQNMNNWDITLFNNL
jgi:energy-coupling factor transporter transmembrane protein EcfT